MALQADLCCAGLPVLASREQFPYLKGSVRRLRLWNRADRGPANAQTCNHFDATCAIVSVQPTMHITCNAIALHTPTLALYEYMAWYLAVYT